VTIAGSHTAQKKWSSGRRNGRNGQVGRQEVNGQSESASLDITAREEKRKVKIERKEYEEKNSKRMTLVTTLRPKENDQFLSAAIFSLRLFLRCPFFLKFYSLDVGAFIPSYV